MEDKNTIEYEISLIKKLQEAINRDSTGFAYQPIVSMDSDGNFHTDYYECLLRILENGNFISAGPHIAAGAKHNFVQEVDDYVVKTLPKFFLKKDPNDAEREFYFSINLSRLITDNSTLIENLREVLKQNPNGAKRLTIEITETSQCSSLEMLSEVLMSFKAYGCKIALDDFGAGETSQEDLDMLPIDVVKIDGSLIRNIDNENTVIIEQVKNIVANAIANERKVVAEFVGTIEVATLLRDIGVNNMQGFLFGKDFPHEDYESIGNNSTIKNTEEEN